MSLPLVSCFYHFASFSIYPILCFSFSFLSFYPFSFFVFAANTRPCLLANRMAPPHRSPQLPASLRRCEPCFSKRKAPMGIRFLVAFAHSRLASSCFQLQPFTSFTFLSPPSKHAILPKAPPRLLVWLVHTLRPPATATFVAPHGEVPQPVQRAVEGGPWGLLKHAKHPPKTIRRKMPSGSKNHIRRFRFKLTRLVGVCLASTQPMSSNLGPKLE